jgi:hypothetical protein
MTRAELALLSQAHAVAMTAMVAPETREVPLTAARVLHRELRDHHLAEALRDAAHGILAAWPYRRKRGEGALTWARAHMDLSAAVARDAFRAALARMEAA